LRTRARPFPARALKSVLVFAPHPDDETLGCGGAVACLELAGAIVHIAFVTDGGASHPEHPLLSVPDLIALRRNEAQAATASLGVEWGRVFFIDAHDGTLAAMGPKESEKIVLKIAALLAKISPDAIFLTCRRDGSTDHDSTFILVSRALQKAPNEPRIFEYPIWSWRNPLLLLKPILSSRAVWRADIKGVLDRKAAALGAYASQIRPIPPDRLPMLSQEFTSEFMVPEEFFFEQ
jgi:LmbE family N-acetylglucosaminyl deacetylase